MAGSAVSGITSQSGVNFGTTVSTKDSEAVFVTPVKVAVITTPTPRPR